MRRPYFMAVLLFIVFTSGVVLSQNTPAITPEPTATVEPTPQVAFEIESEIGRALPRKIVYDPQREQMAVADAYNRLLLINALNYETKAVLHQRGQYNDIAFSHDGRWLAVANGRDIELWDTDSGTLAARLDNTNARQIIGPLAFSSQDELLLFYGIYPAPRALRQSETDTITYPWVWHLPAARKEAASTLPNRLQAVQMFDYPFGFVLSPDDRIVAALPARLRVLDAFTLNTLYEIPTDRYEQDPLTVWNSLRDNTVYVRPVEGSTLLQVDTGRGVLVEIPLFKDLTLEDLSLIGGLELGSVAQTIGQPASFENLPLLQILIGRDYRDPSAYGRTPLTVTLIDLLAPPIYQFDNVRALLFVYDEDRGVGRFLFSPSRAVDQMVLSPNARELLVRQYTDDEYIVTFDIASGRQLRRMLPAQRAIGFYRRGDKNRVLAYDTSGTVIISDFQRLDAATNAVLAEDLRYSRSFDRFFFSDDGQKIITLAGTEWREWDTATGAVLRRGVVQLRGQIIAASADGYRYLTQFNTSDGGGGAEVVDMDTGQRYVVNFRSIPGSFIEDMYANPSWTRFLVVYSANPYGPYSPGNQVAIYDHPTGFRALIAGDDLPPADFREYGWVDDETAYVYGQGQVSAQPGRVYGVDYAPNGLPACVMARYPEQEAVFSRLWERLVYYLRPDKLDEWTKLICADLPADAAGVEALLQLTPTPPRVVITSVPEGEVPQCLKDRFSAEADAYAEVWRAMTADISEAEKSRLAVLLCEGIGPITQRNDSFDPELGVTMFINGQTGERASGDYQAPTVERRPLDQIAALFEKTEGRRLGQAVLSRDATRIAASSMPGELVIYRLLVSYDSVMANVTATAAAQLAAANLIVALPSPSPTYSVIGTPRPTLTPTPTQTLFPRPQQSAFSGGQNADLCPSEQLYSIAAPPPGYAATGSIYAVVSGDNLWSIEPENGVRRPNPDIPQCDIGIRCQFSPDKAWILAESYEAIYVVRPDNSDPRVLWNLLTPFPATPVPRSIYWTGSRALEWQGDIPVTEPATGRTRFVTGYLRDVLNVFPDPPPWIPAVSVNDLPTRLVSRQPGGPWVVAYTVYSTGTHTGYKYYLVHTETGDYQLFAQDYRGQISVEWHPAGDRLFFTFPDNSLFITTYQMRLPELQAGVLGVSPGGVWSNDGRYRAFTTRSRAQPVAVWDSFTGATRSYCLPETGARGYSGPFVWSPDSRYLALNAPLPKDEAVAGVGQHTLILDVETGAVVDLTTGVVNLVLWAQEPGTYGEGRVVTPTPIITPTAAP